MDRHDAEEPESRPKTRGSIDNEGCHCRPDTHLEGCPYIECCKIPGHRGPPHCAPQCLPPLDPEGYMRAVFGGPLMNDGDEIK